MHGEIFVRERPDNNIFHLVLLIGFVPLTLFRIGFFGTAHQKDPTPSPKFVTHIHISYNNETFYSYTLPKEDPKNIQIT